MINQAFCFDDLENHLPCTMQGHLNGVHISELPKLLALSPSITHAFRLPYPFDAAPMLIILL